MSTVILVFILFNKFNSDKIKNVLAPVVNEDYQEKIFSLEKKYEEDMVELYDYVYQGEDLVVIYEKLKESLLTIRVPAERRDLHLKVLLEIFELEKKSQTVIFQKENILQFLAEIVDNFNN